MNITVLAEKPEVAKDIAGAMIPSAKQNKGYYYGNVGEDTWVVISAFGHLLELAEPKTYDAKYERWNMEDLPVYFENWKLVPSEEEYKNNRLKTIEALLAKSDTVICAGDPDDEGQLLIDEILDYCEFKGPMKRVLLNDNLADNIKKEFSELKENNDYRHLSRAASARRMADACFGINESRLAGIKLGRKGLSIGRVQTPTLGLVVTRDEQIENHEKSKFYELFADVDVQPEIGTIPFKFKPAKKYFDDNETKHVTDKAFLDAVLKFIKGKTFPVVTTEKNKISNPPLPYNLTELQSDMNKRYGYEIQKTLDITQSLRSKKAITYNRSDSQYLKEEHFKAAPKLFSVIQGGALISKYNLDFKRHSACFNDKNVTAHHGIIPQEVNIDVSKLTKEERNVYLAICDRYAMQFMENALYRVSTSVIDIKGATYTHTLEYTSTKVIKPGYTAFFKKEKEADEEDESGKIFIPEGTYNGTVLDGHLDEKETKPPSRYNEGSLVKDMSSIAKYVSDPKIKEILKRKDEGKKGENGSIGTVATRGTIVETLIKRGFIERKGKNLISSTLGRNFYHMLPEAICKADITAKWWLLQEALKDGTESDENIIQKSVLEEFMNHKDSSYEGATLSKYEIKEKVEGIYNGETVSVNAVWNGHKFTEEELKTLFEGGTISFPSKTKSGEEYTATGALAKQEYNGHEFFGFKLNDREAADGSGQREGYVSGTWKKKEITIKKIWSGHEFTEEELSQLFAGKTISFEARTKYGKDYTATGKLAKQKFKGHEFYGFKLDDTPKEREGYAVGTWKRKKVSIKKNWGGHEFTEEELKALFADETISFEVIGKDGSPYTATGKLSQQSYNGHEYYGFSPAGK